MKNVKMLTLSGALLVAALTTGCQAPNANYGPNPTANRAMNGALIGAGVGTAIGVLHESDGNSRDMLKGAVIGGLGGAAVGGATGAMIQ